MTNPKHIIIYSHGFGVQKDDNGLLSDIAEKLPEAENILFDYYDIDESANTLAVKPYNHNVQKLQEIINTARENNPGAIIDLIAHSQGTIVVALAQPQGIRKIILLAPPFDLDINRTLTRWESKVGAKIDLDGISIVPSSIGPTKIVPAEYWQERIKVNPMESYNTLAENNEVIAIIANQDEILGIESREGLSSKINLVPLDGNHGFSGEHRTGLIRTIRSYLI